MCSVTYPYCSQNNIKVELYDCLQSLVITFSINAVKFICSQITNINYEKKTSWKMTKNASVSKDDMKEVWICSWMANAVNVLQSGA